MGEVSFRTVKYLSFLLALLFSSLAGKAGEFINLDFEQANLTGSQLEYRTVLGVGFPFDNFPFGTGPTAQLLPGWNVSYLEEIGGVSQYRPVDTIAIGNGFFDAPSLGPHPSHVGLIIPGNYVHHAQISPYPGNALVFDDLARGILGEIPQRMRVSQVGTVPQDAQLLTFSLFEGFSLMQLMVGGTFRDVTTVSFDPNDPTKRYFDISPRAGQEIEIGFDTGGGQYYVIDDLAFVIPEPSTVSLLALGGAVLLFRLGKRRGTM
jgi:hypothetical protein